MADLALAASDAPIGVARVGDAPWDLRRSALLGAGAVVVESAYWAIFLRHYQPQSDANQYMVMARNVAAGRGVADSFLQAAIRPTAFRPPLYPAMLGGLFHVFGVHVAVAQAANVVLGALVVILAERVITKIAGPRAGLVAAVVVGLCPSLLANDAVPLSEPLGLLLFLVALLFIIDRRWLPAGATIGLFLLTRPTGPALLGVVVIWLIFRVGWRVSVRVLIAAALVVTPWIVRNEIQLGTAEIVTSNGFNLSAMYSPEAIARGGFVDPVKSPQFSWLRPAQVGEAKWNQILIRRGLSGAISHPGYVAQTVVSNVEHLSELLPNDVPERADGRNIPFRTDTLPLFYVTSVVGLLGFWRHRRNPYAPLLLLLAAAVVLPSALTVVAPRLRATLDLALAMGVGLMFDSTLPAGWRLWFRRSPRERGPRGEPVDYVAAWADWEGSDDRQSWENVTSDGLVDAER